MDSTVSSIPRGLRITIAVLLIIFLAALSLDRAYLAGINLKNLMSWQKPASSSDTIVVSADAKVVAVPDVALTTLSVESRGKTPADVLADNRKKMNDMTSYLKGLGIADKDIRTSQFNLMPNYVYNSDAGRQDIDGYILTQSLDVKIRDLKKVGDVLSEAVNRGANQVGQLSFIIDDPAQLLQQARLDAIKKAQDKAQSLAAAAGLKIGKVRNFSEDLGGDYYQPMMAQSARNMTGMGTGGGSPDIQPGSNEVNVTVSLTFEVE